LNHRPIRVLMTALAEMLPGKWTRTDDGYEVAMTDKGVFARAEWWHLFLGEREKSLALQRQAVLAAMQTKGFRRKASDPEPEEASDPAAEAESADQHDFFHSLPQALKEQIAANLEETPFYEVEHMTFSNDEEQVGTIGWLSQMPPQTQAMFKTAMQDYINNHLAGAPPAFQKYAIQAQNGLATLDPSKVYFLFQNGGFTVLATPFNGPPSASTTLDLHVPMTMNAPVLSLNQTELANVVYGGADLPPAWKQRAATLRQTGTAVSPDMKMLVYQVYGMGEAAPQAWKQLAAYQRGRVWPNLLPKLPPEDHSAWHPEISRAAQTDWLGERGGMEYVSDYYSHGGYTMPEAQKKLPVRRPLATELDEMASRRDVSWKKDADGIYLVRNNRWYRDDNLEVPQPLLRRWFGALLQARKQEAAAQAAVPVIPQTPEERLAALKQNWDWAADVYNALTPWQIRNGLALFQPEEKDLSAQNDASAAKYYEPVKHHIPQPGEIVPPGFDAYLDTVRRPPFWGLVNRVKGFPHTAQLYGSLDDAGRAALLKGNLPASALSATQLAQAVSLQPLLPQALQAFPPDAVLLRLPYSSQPTARTVFGELSLMRLEVVTPLPARPSAP
ncbi:MAG: hypothetical protein M3Y13_02970, partial [Armatimonadota bacterium]|nr:hypothetical protein [Armatimonadota bacterium]